MVRAPVHQWHRYQFAWVVRDGVVYEWSADLGPKDDFSAPEIDIPGLWEHTVGELWDIAERYRLGEDHWRNRIEEIASESTIITDLIDQLEERAKIIHNRSVFGAGGRKQRNGFSRRALLEQRH